MPNLRLALSAALIAVASVITFAAPPDPVAPAKPTTKQPVDHPNLDPDGHDIFESLKVKPPKPPRTSVAAVGRRFALLVGVGQAEINGQKENPLPVCPGDALAMASALKLAAYDCTILADGENDPAERRPTLAHARDAVAAVCAKAGPSDQVLIYFSTHGIILPGPKGSVIDGPSILAMNDGPLKIEDVKASLASCKALTRILILDCCRDNKHFAPRASEFRDVHVVTACRPDETSMTGPRGLSVFTEAFVAGITDCRADRYADGQIELDELLNFVVDEVPRRAKEMDEHASQNPTRTVVDPRTVNPIIVSCAVPSSTEILDSLMLPTALQGPVQALPRNDLVLAGSIAGKITIGMTEKEMAAAMGRAPDDPANCDAPGNNGDGLAMYMNTPKKNDTVFVFFGKSRVTRVMVMYAKLCDGEFNAAKSRAKLTELLGGKDLLDIGEVLHGQHGLPTTKELFDALGCPTGGLMYGQDHESGSVHYDDVPLPGQRLTFILKEGTVTDVSLGTKPKWGE